MVVGDGVVSAPEERPDFAVVHGGQFPKPASPFSLFLVQEDFSVMAGDEDIFFDGDDWPSRFFQWQGGRVGGLAPWAHGAEQAGRGTGSAEALAEFHQGGVIRSHVLGGQQAFRPFPELALAGGPQASSRQFAIEGHGALVSAGGGTLSNDPDALEALQIGVDQVIAAVQAANRDLPAGAIARGFRRA